jgi:hypothetical protein
MPGRTAATRRSASDVERADFGLIFSPVRQFAPTRFEPSAVARQLAVFDDPAQSGR